MDETPVRLGGMALQNGVLVHGPTAWGCAVRDESGALRVASGRKPHLAPASGYRVEEGTYPLERLLAAEEAFTSSSVREVMPVVVVDDRPYASREAADALQHALREAARR